MGEDDIRKLLKTSSQIAFNLEGGTEPNTHALDDVLQYIAGNSRMHVKTSMKSIKDRFMKAPCGFRKCVRQFGTYEFQNRKNCNLVNLELASSKLSRFSNRRILKDKKNF